ncbi:hypothetical protein RRG08_044699 [Elysia crispata]|uniref:DDE-1 domain-containing protein n=1 Tax=Elysia crispata TaxID=231223 RepID=A0AAE0ZZC9_9GAST|nr:hypothetical protein RRG08_044699 [Elysia crispata]
MCFQLALSHDLDMPPSVAGVQHGWRRLIHLSSAILILLGPPGSQRGANPSGWMYEEQLVMFLKHLALKVKCTKESPILLLLDNYDSHLNIEWLNFASDNGIVMLSFPPHCNLELQLLCMGQTIFPFKRDFFSHSDFAPSYITECPRTIFAASRNSCPSCHRWSRPSPSCHPWFKPSPSYKPWSKFRPSCNRWPKPRLFCYFLPMRLTPEQIRPLAKEKVYKK